MQVFDIEDVLPFQHTAARRRLVHRRAVPPPTCQVSTHSRPKAAGYKLLTGLGQKEVSTHSRPKAAGKIGLLVLKRSFCFNTQPPEGGWNFRMLTKRRITCFNTQPPEGGWVSHWCISAETEMFQHTAARRRLESRMSTPDPTSGFNTQPPEGGWIQYWQQKSREASVSTHSRPKAAGISILSAN